MWWALVEAGKELTIFDSSAKETKLKNTSFNIPILLLIYNRPDLTHRVFSRIKEMKPQKLYIAADGPNESKSERENCLATRAVVEKADWNCRVKTLFRDSNLGCRKAVSSAIDWFFSHVQQGIILEDDCLPLKSFFGFCETLLDHYKNDRRIMMISGNNFQNGQKRGDGTYYFTKYCHIWGWATWKHAWKQYDVHMRSYPIFKASKQIENIFSRKDEQEYWMSRFEQAFDGKIDTWDYQWVYAVFRNNGLAIMPNQNLVRNIGFDQRGTHTSHGKKHKDKMHTSEMRQIKHPTFILPQRDAELYTLREIYKVKQSQKRKRFLKRIINIG